MLALPIISILGVQIASLIAGVVVIESVFNLPGVGRMLVRDISSRDLEKVQTPFTGIAAHLSFGANLSARGQTQDGEGMLVSGSYFPVLGVSPALGRLLGTDDNAAPGEPHVVVLSYAYWQKRLFEAREKGWISK